MSSTMQSDSLTNDDLSATRHRVGRPGRLQGLSSEPVHPLQSRWTRVEGPVLALYVAFSERGVSFVRSAEALEDRPEEFVEAFRGRFGRAAQFAESAPPGLSEAVSTGVTADLKFDLEGISAFGQDVLAATATIPKGETRTYGWVARAIGRPEAVRAVGTALGRNPVPVLIPCHRVTRRDGSIGDYAFGSGAKQRLLEAEGADLERPRQSAAEGPF